MQDAVYIRKGHGYETGCYGRCDAFDGYNILTNPLGGYSSADRDRRVFNRNEKGFGGTCYGAYTIRLARKTDGMRDLYILMQHGAGREVWRVPAFYDGGALLAAILALPEPEQFALLFTIWKTAAYARKQAETETAQRWGNAFAEGRLKKRRAARGRPARIEIVPPVETVA
jgi:hypothetical protein